MIIIHFGLLRSQYCKICYFLTLRYVSKFDNLHICEVCEDNTGYSWIHCKCRQRFYQTFTHVFLLLYPRFYVFQRFFLIFIWTFITYMVRMLGYWPDGITPARQGARSRPTDPRRYNDVVGRSRDVWRTSGLDTALRVPLGSMNSLQASLVSARESPSCWHVKRSSTSTHVACSWTVNGCIQSIGYLHALQAASA